MLKVVMKEGVEILGKHITLINMEVLLCGKSLGRVQLGHVKDHPLCMGGASSIVSNDHKYRDTRVFHQQTKLYCRYKR